MTKRPIIAPSLLAADFGSLRAEITDLTKAGADWLHIDVMDGKFVPPITFGDNVVALATKYSTLPRDVHLMIVNPEQHIETFARAGASRIVVHQEVSPHLHRTLGAISGVGCRAGVAINPSTPVEMIFDVLPLCDLVLVMSVNPGWGGQQFISRTLKKIELLRKEIALQKCDVLIEVDGGINRDTGRLCMAAGADVLVAGTAICTAPDRAAAIAELRG